MEKEKGVPEVDFPLLTHLLFYVPQISQIFRKRLRVKSGEEWRKLFTRASS